MTRILKNEIDPGTSDPDPHLIQDFFGSDMITKKLINKQLEETKLIIILFLVKYFPVFSTFSIFRSSAL